MVGAVAGSHSLSHAIARGLFSYTWIILSTTDISTYLHRTSISELSRAVMRAPPANAQ
jgi:hypothetical protein